MEETEHAREKPDSCI